MAATSSARGVLLALVVALCSLTQGASACATGFSSPYLIKHKSTRKVRGGLRHCFQISGVRFPKGTLCSDFSLRKVEFDTNKKCIGKMKDLTWDGQKRNPSLQYFKLGQVTKLTGGPLATHNNIMKKPIMMCFTLTGACANLSAFCRQRDCAGSVAFFDMKLDCCPINGPGY